MSTELLFQSIIIVLVSFLVSKYVEKKFYVSSTLTLIVIGLCLSIFASLKFNFNFLVIILLPLILIYDSISIEYSLLYH
jgi:hypothetical protein